LSILPTAAGWLSPPMAAIGAIGSAPETLPEVNPSTTLSSSTIRTFSKRRLTFVKCPPEVFGVAIQPYSYLSLLHWFFRLYARYRCQPCTATTLENDLGWANSSGPYCGIICYWQD
jgi:hypothetical protein